MRSSEQAADISCILPHRPIFRLRSADILRRPLQVRPASLTVRSVLREALLRYLQSADSKRRGCGLLRCIMPELCCPARLHSCMFLHLPVHRTLQVRSGS